MSFDYGFYQVKPNTLLALITPAANGVIFRNMALKRPALYVCLWEFDREHTANKGWCNKGQQGIYFL